MDTRDRGKGHLRPLGAILKKKAETNAPDKPADCTCHCPRDEHSLQSYQWLDCLICECPKYTAGPPGKKWPTLYQEPAAAPQPGRPTRGPLFQPKPLTDLPTETPKDPTVNTP